jgi:electron transfer flavoprotein alpha subunit
MERVLFLSAVEPGGALSKHALEALGAAKSLVDGLPGSTLTVGLLGGDTQPGSAAVAACGAVKFLSVAGDAFQHPRYASDAAAATALCKAAEATVVVAPGSSRLSRCLPGVAGRLGGRVDTHLVGLVAKDGGPVVNRWYYRQRMEAVLTRTQRPWLLLVDAGAFPAWSGAAGTAQVTQVPVEVTPALTRTTYVGVQAPQSSEQTIRPDAETLFVAGAGWTKKQKDGQPHVAQAAELILGFLRAAKASLGSSKSLVDMGGEGQAVLPFLTHLNQVGQTGATPRHPKGLAACCHGEEPHVVGWRFIKDRRAINLDANCGWARGKADVLYVADAFEVMAKVNALLGK